MPPQRSCVSQTWPAFRLGRRSSLQLRTLVCSHTVAHSPSLPFFNSRHPVIHVNKWITTHSSTPVGCKADLVQLADPPRTVYLQRSYLSTTDTGQSRKVRGPRPTCSPLSYDANLIQNATWNKLLRAGYSSHCISVQTLYSDLIFQHPSMAGFA